MVEKAFAGVRVSWCFFGSAPAEVGGSVGGVVEESPRVLALKKSG